eukprot:2410534-Prymnesium_polylepis.2
MIDSRPCDCDTARAVCTASPRQQRHAHWEAEPSSSSRRDHLKQSTSIAFTSAPSPGAVRRDCETRAEGARGAQIGPLC